MESLTLSKVHLIPLIIKDGLPRYVSLDNISNFDNDNAVFHTNPILIYTILFYENQLCIIDVYNITETPLRSFNFVFDKTILYN